MPSAGRLERAAHAAGIETRRLDLGPPERRTAAAYAGAALAPFVLRGADAVLLNGLSTQRVVPALRLTRRRAGQARHPAVLRVDNPLLEPPRAWRRVGFWDRVGALIADSEHVARECAAAGAPVERIVTAYPPAWSGDRPPGALGAARERGRRVGFVGTIEPRKGVLELIAAAEGFLAGRDSATLTLVGEAADDDPDGYGERVRAAARNSPVASRISFEGWRDDAAAAIADFDLIVVPSLAEPFGTVAAEAAAAGVAVVASEVGGLVEVVRDGESGLLVAPGDVLALARTIGALLDEPDRLRALGERALELAERFSPRAYADAVAAVLGRVRRP